MNISQSNTRFRIRNWSIGTRLAVGFGLILLLTIGLAATSLFSLFSMQQTVDNALTQGLQIEALGNQIQKELSMARRQEQSFLLNWSNEGYENAVNSYLIPHGDHITRLRQTTVELYDLTVHSQEKTLAEIHANTQQLLIALEAYRNEFNLVAESIRTQGTDENISTVKLENAALAIQLLALDIVDRGSKLADAELNSVDESVGKTRNNVIVIVAISVVLSVSLAIISTRQINRPLRLLTNMAEEIEEGNLSARAEINSADELGQLAGNFNAMAVRLDTLVNNLEQQVAERTVELTVVNQKLEREIGERKRTEREIEERWLYLKGVLEAAPDAIVTMDAQQQVVEWNSGAERLFGYSRQEAIGRNLDSLITNADTYEEAIRFSKTTMSQESLFNAETLRCRKDDSLVDVLVSASPIRVKDENIGAVAIYTDITERKRAERAVKQARAAAEAASQAKSAFLANMSHELRTPLNGILGYAQILKRGRDLSMAQRDGLDIIQQSGNHLLTLINDILDLSKIEAGKMELHPTQIHFPNFIAGLVSIIRMRAQQKNIRFIYEAGNNLPQGILADETRLRQILINLLGNAVKFTDKGSVTLRVTRQGDRPACLLVFEVEDTGPGMSPDQLEKIFQPFEQIGDAQQRAEGTGLGLAISRQLVEVMGGQLQVTSETGQGSAFRFEATFPIVEAIAKDEQASRPEIVAYKGERRMVLVVDDKQENRLVLLGMLEPLGFDIEMAENGQVAVDRVGQFQPDLILMDLIMPVLTGFEAVKMIRQMPEMQDTPIIAVSASVLDMDQVQSQRVGCNAFLPKPVIENELLVWLEKLMSLEWVFDNAELEPSVEDQEAPVQDAPLAPPPQDELEILYELAIYGNMDRIQEQAAHLEKLDKKYTPFANKLRQLASEFEDEQILALIEQFKEERQ